MAKARAWVIELSLILGIGMLLAALGPFGSFSGSFASRLLYWVPTVLVGYAIFRPVTALAARIAGALNLPYIFGLLAGGLIAAVPASVAIAYIGGFRFGRGASFEALFQLYLNVALIGFAIGALFVILESRDASRTSRTEVAESVVSPSEPVRGKQETQPKGIPFFERLPPSWTGNLAALEMEDHYVRVYDRAGKSLLILMRMADAERELIGADGARVHRSWWVMRDCVIGGRREGRNIRLELAGGLTAPVSRDRLKALRGAGWPL